MNQRAQGKPALELCSGASVVDVAMCMDQELYLVRRDACDDDGLDNGIRITGESCIDQNGGLINDEIGI
jgi:hypothetical protein